MKWFIFVWFLLVVVAASALAIGITMQWLQGGVIYV